VGEPTAPDSSGDLHGLLTEVDRKLVGDHLYIKLALNTSSDFRDKLSNLIRATYFDKKKSKERLSRAAHDLTKFNGEKFEFTDEQIADALAEELDAVIPSGWRDGSDAPEHLDVRRSELAEIIGREALTVTSDCVVPASRIRHKEIPDQPTRGADVIGIESVNTPPLHTLLLGEVKGSGDRKSPPGVVAGMQTKLTQLTTDRRVLLQELLWLCDNADDEHVDLCHAVCLKFQFKTPLELVLTPILIRTTSTAADTDPGKFATDADSFNYCIRFISVILPTEDLYEFAVEIYSKARELGQDER